jgi:hypothetical protein
MHMQLQDKLLAYKQEMGLLPASSGGGTPQALPAKGETSAGGHNEEVANDGSRVN